MMNLADIKHVGIMRLSALGDIVLLTPMIRTLQKKLPHAKITWITSKASYQLLQGLDGIEFIVIDKPRNLRDYLNLRKQFQALSFDVLLALQANLRVNLLYPFIKAPVKIGFDAKRARDLHGLFVNRRIPFAKQHLLDSFFSFIEHLGINEKLIEWNLPISSDDHQWAAQQLGVDARPLLAINPMASKVERTWLTDRYIEVMYEAKQRWNCRLVLTGGPADAEKKLADEIATNFADEVINLVGKTTPKQLAAVLAKTKCLIAPDTGPAHLACAMGTQVIGLYAVAPPELSAPYLSKELVINAYPTAVQKFLHRDPATVKWGTRVHDLRAMELITVDDVMLKLATIFN